MPDLMTSPFDRPVPVLPVGDRPPVVLPQSLWQAMARGIGGRCPRCGQNRLFRAFLKPVDHCRRCQQDWTLQRADDFPAYASLFITGHLMAPLAVYLARDSSLSVALISAIVLPTTAALAIGFLQPSKGGIIAVQWWMGMHGFRRERPAGDARR
jgi:uncharacterized protein (DUF983 family)